jgi:hypothetical protein
MEHGTGIQCRQLLRYDFDVLVALRNNPSFFIIWFFYEELRHECVERTSMDINRALVM